MVRYITLVFSGVEGLSADGHLHGLSIYTTGIKLSTATVEQISSRVRLLHTRSILWLTVPTVVFITNGYHNATDKWPFLPLHLSVAGMDFFHVDIVKKADRKISIVF